MSQILCQNIEFQSGCLVYDLSPALSQLWQKRLSLQESLFSCHRGRAAGIHTRARILSLYVSNHCIKYKIPSGPVNIVGYLNYLVHLYSPSQASETYHLHFYL